jgi:hypothetical protein
MGFITAIVAIHFAQAQTPDWNKPLPNNGELPEFILGEPQGVGVGAYIGKPISVALSYYTGTRTTQALFGMWFPDVYRFSLDQLFLIFSYTQNEYVSVLFNTGLGLNAYFNEPSSGDYYGGGDTTHDYYGVRLPINVAFNHSELAFDAYFELVPSLQYTFSLNTGLSFKMYGGVGVRVYPFSKEK